MSQIFSFSFCGLLTTILKRRNCFMLWKKTLPTTIGFQTVIHKPFEDMQNVSGNLPEQCNNGGYFVCQYNLRQSHQAK